MTILAIDPGTVQSAWLEYDPDQKQVGRFRLESNEDVLEVLRLLYPFQGTVVIEKMESYGLPVGQEVFETLRWAGRFEEAASPTPVEYWPRRYVRKGLHLPHTAGDPGVRAALIDRFGGSEATGKGGPLYGIHADLWSALAIAVTYGDRETK